VANYVSHSIQRSSKSLIEKKKRSAGQKFNEPMELIASTEQQYECERKKDFNCHDWPKALMQLGTLVANNDFGFQMMRDYLTDTLRVRKQQAQR
jgi:hypothetical protein